MHNSTNDLVSVYIPTHNRAAMLARAVKSIIKQTYNPIEIIIVNDASTDNTDKVVNALLDNHKNITYIKNDTPKGACHARNIAIKSAKGHYITGLDDDDYFLPERISELVKSYESHLSFVCSDELTTTNGTDFKHAKSSSSIIDLNTMLYSNAATNQVLTEKEKIIKSGLFDESLINSQDYDMWLRMVIKYGPGKRLRKPLIVFDQAQDRKRISTNLNKSKGFEQFYLKHQHLMNPLHRRAQMMRVQLSKENKITLIHYLRFTTHKTFWRDFKILIRGYYQ